MHDSGKSSMNGRDAPATVATVPTSAGRGQAGIGPRSLRLSFLPVEGDAHSLVLAWRRRPATKTRREVASAPLSEKLRSVLMRSLEEDVS